MEVFLVNHDSLMGKKPPITMKSPLENPLLIHDEFTPTFY